MANVTIKPKRPFWQILLINIALMCAAILLLVSIAMFGLSIWTHHGQEADVPAVKGLDYSGAVTLLAQQGFTHEVADSVYDTSSRPGTVMDQTPKPGAKVKDGRKVYLTINAFSPKTVVLPAVTDMSLRQARAALESVGISDISIHTVPSEYKDLVIGISCNGAALSPGSRIPVNSRVTIIVGGGAAPADDCDTAAEDSDDTDTESNWFD